MYIMLVHYVFCKYLNVQISKATCVSLHKSYG